MARTNTRYNRSEGYSYISETFGYDIAAFHTIKYIPAYDGGRFHKNVQLGDLTPCSPFDNCLAEDLKRISRTLINDEPELVEEVNDSRLPIEKLCNALINGARRGKKKGWYCFTLQLSNVRYIKRDEER